MHEIFKFYIRLNLTLQYHIFSSTENERYHNLTPQADIALRHGSTTGDSTQ